jgi:hypothetical protein
MKKIVRYGSVSSYKNLASYFKEMASKGYLISFIQTGVHYFDIVNPVDLDFEVIIFNEFDLSIYGDRKKYIDDMKKKGWKYVLNNDKMIVFYKKSTEDTYNSDNDKQQYEMVKSIWNRNKLKNFLTILIALFLYVSNIYDYEFTKIYISNNFMKIIIPIIAFIILAPVIGKTPYWLYKNKKSIYKGEKLYHRTKRADKLLDLYMYSVLYFVLPIIILRKWLVFFSGGDYIAKALILIILFMPLVAYVIFNSNYFRPFKLKRIRFLIYFAVVLIYLFSVYMVGFYFVSRAVK